MAPIEGCVPSDGVGNGSLCLRIMYVMDVCTLYPSLSLLTPSYTRRATNNYVLVYVPYPQQGIEVVLLLRRFTCAAQVAFFDFPVLALFFFFFGRVG